MTGEHVIYGTLQSLNYALFATMQMAMLSTAMGNSFLMSFP